MTSTQHIDINNSWSEDCCKEDYELAKCLIEGSEESDSEIDEDSGAYCNHQSFIKLESNENTQTAVQGNGKRNVYIQVSLMFLHQQMETFTLKIMRKMMKTTM